MTLIGVEAGARDPGRGGCLAVCDPLVPLLGGAFSTCTTRLVLVALAVFADFPALADFTFLPESMFFGLGALLFLDGSEPFRLADFFGWETAFFGVLDIPAGWRSESPLL